MALADAAVVLAAKMFEDGTVVLKASIEETLRDPECQNLSQAAKD